MWGTAANRGGADAVKFRPGRRALDRAQHEPRARKVLAVPSHCGGKVGDHLRFTGFRHAALLQLGEMVRQQRTTD